MKRTFLITGAILGLIGILLGAFGAHGLERIADYESVDSFETGVRYQMYHAFFFLFVGLWGGMKGKSEVILYRLTLTGVILFSASIYILVIGKALSFDLKYLGPVTPVGGILLIFSWIFLAYSISTQKRANN
ncbi:DUF423 domain-containing protein [Flagellimonas meridianipacifica]|uniref:Uncharacterized membrane protein YgdD (TMEM256/DUF423 family) n=1 Tax=Flagellimonas meridianipacifica TaxID=1080225 RepID=A0A2T0MG38_9FLAO|nr:DUF423 domain-containing protein [Allomuricauda pacifica]PRX56540.1 uncharacterized membrane protein YgdD (TMEM256/DUF423 family) [Allomuricauda pacifica]